MTLPDPSTFLAAGASAEVFRLGDGRVLKLFHAGIDPGIVAREYAIAQAVQATDLPVAPVWGMQDAAGRQGIVYGEIEGPSLLDYVRRRPHRLPWALNAMARLQQQIHAQRVPIARSRKRILAEDIAASTVNARLREAAIERLDWLNEPDRLSHGDLHLANLIVTPGGLAVIDWSKAARASPAADVARSEMLMRFGPGGSDDRWHAMARDGAAAYYLWRYQRRTGLAVEALVAWRALVALAWARHRLPGRDAAFAAYLDTALRQAGFPPL
ncbi:MAG: phosphotransferase [bacterium]|nr:phosphotransferase [bacterium]